MDIDCIFNSLHNLKLIDILNCLIISKSTNTLNNNYLWKLLCLRDWKIKFDEKNYYDKYKIYYSLNKIIKYNDLKIDLNHLLTNTKLSLNNELTIIPTEIGFLNNLKEFIFRTNMLIT